MRRITLSLLGLLAVGLCAIIATEWAHRTTKELPASRLVAVRSSQAPPTVAGSDGQVHDWVATILARPVFEPSRRPPAAPAAAAAGAEAFPRLTGTIITPERRLAIFAIPGQARPVVVSAGSRLNGVLIKKIEDGAIVIVSASGTHRVRPSFDTSAKAPAAAAPPPGSFTIDLSPAQAPIGTSPFASIRGLSGRPLGLAATPDLSPPPSGGTYDTMPSPPALAPTGGSP